MKSELHVENELLFYKHRLVIPSELQRKIAKWLHDSHLVIEKTLVKKIQASSTKRTTSSGRDFVAVFDAYSNYLIALKVNNKTSKHIIDIICGVFDKIGFKFSSPRHPQSNGLSEKGVGISKNILKRCYEENQVDQFQYRIPEYNATPIASMRLTPSEIYFGRLLKTKLPVSDSLLVRNYLNENYIGEKI